MKKKSVEIFGFIFAFIIIILLLIGFGIFGPKKIIEIIGIKNSYFIIFLFAIFGGVSAFTSTTFYATLATFYLGELNFFIIALIGAIGLTIGDSLFYHLGKKSHDFFNETRHKEKINYLKKFMKRIPKKWLFVFILIYTGLSPLPKDILCVVLGITNFEYKKFALLFFIGNLTFNLIFLMLISMGFSLIAI
jgi:membrane protein YqaA with SNARE-associated domain